MPQPRLLLLLLVAACAPPGPRYEALGIEVAPRAAADLAPGDLVITELHLDPAAVPDRRGEWFEIHNASGATVRLDGLVITDDGGQRITVTTRRAFAAGEYITFGANASAAANGGITHDIVYSGAAFTLDEAGDEVVLSNAAGELDRVAVSVADGWSVPSGSTLGLDPDRTDTVDNDDPSAWCAAQTPYGAGDLGTPGAANDACADPPVAATRPRVGAIRWDAWQEDGTVNTTVEGTLGPAHWHDRMPWFGVETGTDSVSVRGNSQALMDEEIATAADAGIDYWAFVTYPPDEAMSNGLDLYLASADRRGVDFALVLQGGWLASAADAEWDTQVARYVELFSDPSYVLVEEDRPLVYLFDAESMWGGSRFPTPASATAAFDTLRAATVAAGLGAPYLVFMGWDFGSDPRVAGRLGFDALSAYAVAGGVDGGSPYSALMDQAEATWELHAASGLEVVPVLGAGWDPRPRIETPTPWATYSSAWFEQPSAEELAAHLTAGLSWVDAHPDVAPADVLILYAWNEHDEGGWICPTWTTSGPDTSRVDAIAAALSAYTPAVSLQNGDFEAPPVDGGWYVVPADGVDSAFAWSSGTAARAYLLADPTAAHFTAAADGSQALYAASAGWIEQTVPVDAGDVHLSWSLLTGTFRGDVGGTVAVSLSMDGVPVASTSATSPATAGTWEAHSLDATVAAGDLVVRFEVTSGTPWLDGVALSR